jgi:hypothetical protein
MDNEKERLARLQQEIDKIEKEYQGHKKNYEATGERQEFDYYEGIREGLLVAQKILRGELK